VAKRRGQDFREWALLGAEQRLLQIAEEAASIHRAFPELRKKTSQVRRLSRGTELAGAPTGPKRRRRKLSAAARKRISEAQKARWAKQRTGKKP